MKSHILGCLILCYLGRTALSIECHKCWPPLEESVCKRTTERIDCRGYKDIGYDNCIEMRFHGNNTLSRTCYQSFKCAEAREWCRRYGPCTVKCCDYNMCNPASTFKNFSVFYFLIPIATLKWLLI